MPELPRSSRYVVTPDVVLEEAERADLVERLNVAYADGLIAADAYERHLDRLFAAQKLGEVAAVVAELPVKPTHDTPAVVPVGAGKPGELAPIKSPAQSRGLMVALGGLGAGALLLLVVLLVLL